MRMTGFRGAALAIGAVVIVLAGYVASQFAFNVWWQSPQRIEQHLLSETPLGTSQDVVVRWLASHAVSQTEVVLADVSPDHSYPLSSAHGTAFLRAVVHKEPIIGDVITAFYVFNDAGALVSLRVRREHDSL